MLDTQYRMIPKISKFPSDTFYEGKLKDGENVKQPDYVPKRIKEFIGQNFSGSNISFDHIKGHMVQNQNSFVNEDEANRLVEYLKNAKEYGVVNIGVISPYKG